MVAEVKILLDVDNVAAVISVSLPQVVQDLHLHHRLGGWGWEEVVHAAVIDLQATKATLTKGRNEM